METNQIKNFCIIAHIDHGKSTLSDRLIEITSAVSDREMKPQFLDFMDLERERGITIKMNSIRLMYKGIQLNLIDTPGHVDFSYEVSRSLSACEGAILLIDITKGIQAQTISNFFLAKKANLTIVVAINKIDISQDRLEEVKYQIENSLGLDSSEVVHISSKTGSGVEALLDKCIETFPSAPRLSNKPLKAILFDSYYDTFKGVIIFTRIFEGEIRKGDEILLWRVNKKVTVLDVGIKNPYMTSVPCLKAGEVGWISSNIRSIQEVKVGDTITHAQSPCDEVLDGYEQIMPMVYASFFPLESEKQNLFKSSIEKLSLSDGSFVYQYESASSLGFGCRCGFMGLLHLDVIKERLSREYGVNVIVTNPSVKYLITLKTGENMYLISPSEMPDLTKIANIQEPYVLVFINVPKEYIGSVMDIMDKFRSKYVDLDYLSFDRALLKYDLPLSEIVQNFYDAIKTVTKGYGIVDYEMIGYKPNKLVKVDILLNGVIASPFSFISDVTQSYYKAKQLVEKLKENIHPHLFEIAIQAVINGKVIVRENVKSFRKNVTAKCYGGDITRKKKLLEQQKKGKKKMKQIGKVLISDDIFKKIFTN